MTGWKAIIALGSNLGDRLSYLRRGVESVGNHPLIQVVRCSPVYENAAMTKSDLDTGQSDEGQPDFLNAVMAVETTLSPLSLLDVLHEVEAATGRQRNTSSWEARQLDLDLLIFEDLSLQVGRLTLPHAGLARRRFVLQPLFDIAPDLHVPEPINMSVRNALKICTDVSTLNDIGATLC